MGSRIIGQRLGTFLKKLSLHIHKYMFAKHVLIYTLSKSEREYPSYYMLQELFGAGREDLL